MSDQTQEQTGEITKIPIRLFCSRGRISAEQVYIYIYITVLKKTITQEEEINQTNKFLKIRKDLCHYIKQTLTMMMIDQANLCIEQTNDDTIKKLLHLKT